MSAVICFPQNTENLPNVNIYRANSATDPYALIDTVSYLQMEYEDFNGDYSKYYSVSFANNDHETEKVPILSVVQSVIDVIRSELNIQEDDIAASAIDFLTKQAKIDIQMDLCTFKYGVEIFHVDNSFSIFRLPNRYFYDLNCAGVVSILDIEVWKQVKPITVYSPKIKLTPIYIDAAPEARYVQIAETCTPFDSVKLNYYYATRAFQTEALQGLIAYRIAAIYYENISIAGSTSNFNSIKIGDISVSRGSSGSSSVIQDSYYKMNSKYRKLLEKMKAGFMRVR